MGGFREVSALFLICFQSWPAEKPEPGPRGVPDAASELRVLVNVYNGVNVSSSELSRAERKAEKIFLNAGIQLTWTTGLLAADLNDNATNLRWNAASLQLRLWTRAAAGNRPTSSETLGLCLSLEHGDAVILADAIQKRAVVGKIHFADLLGLVIAHELGHLLLRSADHSADGIMQARWGKKELNDGECGYLRFTPAEAESMRSEVRQRMGVKSPSSNNRLQIGSRTALLVRSTDGSHPPECGDSSPGEPLGPDDGGGFMQERDVSYSCSGNSDVNWT
jgi:hypothetical protein